MSEETKLLGDPQVLAILTYQGEDSRGEKCPKMLLKLRYCGKLGTLLDGFLHNDGGRIFDETARVLREK